MLFKLKKVNLLFIHIPKNAGTAVEKSLRKKYKSDYNNLVYFFINLIKLPIIIKILKIIYLIFLKNIFIDFPKNKIYHYHSNYLEYIDKYNVDLKKTIVFSVVRHPQDRIISIYYFLQYSKEISFFNFLELFLNPNKNIKHLLNFFFRSQTEYLKNSKVHILKYENIDNDWKYFCKKYDIEFEPLLKKNVTKTRKNLNIKEYFKGNLGKKYALKIYNIYKEDFDNFGYKIIY